MKIFRLYLFLSRSLFVWRRRYCKPFTKAELWY